MRRIALFIASTVASLVLLFSYHTSRGSSTVTPVTVALGEAGVVSGSGSIVAPTVAPTVSASVAGTLSASGSVPPSTENLSVTGTVVQTRWGPVQVQVAIVEGKITDVTALQYPADNPRDQEINSRALPELRDQVIAAQSANIDGVSGATVTSRGYMQSLQAALDTAHLG